MFCDDLAGAGKGQSLTGRQSQDNAFDDGLVHLDRRSPFYDKIRAGPASLIIFFDIEMGGCKWTQLNRLFNISVNHCPAVVIVVRLEDRNREFGICISNAQHGGQLEGRKKPGLFGEKIPGSL